MSKKKLLETVAGVINVLSKQSTKLLRNGSDIGFIQKEDGKRYTFLTIMFLVMFMLKKRWKMFS
jgi:hypothetical protein